MGALSVGSTERLALISPYFGTGNFILKDRIKNKKPKKYHLFIIKIKYSK